MPSRSGSGRGSPSDREKRTNAGRRAAAPKSSVCASPSLCVDTTSSASYTAPCGCTALPPLSAAKAASAPPTVNPAAPTAIRRGRVSPRRAFSPTRTASESALARHLAAPGARLLTARLDELLEPLEVALDAPVGDAEGVTDLLLQALGHEIHLDGDARGAVVDLVERHDACVVLAVDVAPGDALLRLLLDDLRIPLVSLAAEFGDRVQPALVELRDRLNALHELREFLELRPLVVRRVDRHIDFDRLFDCRRHPLSLLVVRGPLPEAPGLESCARTTRARCGRALGHQVRRQRRM